MDVIEVLLPGVGLRYEFTTASGTRLGLIARRDGSFDLVRYDIEDPDTSVPLVSLTRAEAVTVADIFGAPRISERFADLSREVPGLGAATIEVPKGSRYDGKTLADTKARTRTGASVVAIVRGKKVVASPTPAERLIGGDSLVIVGTDAGIEGVRELVGG